MTDELGYSIRNLATKLSKDKGYVENRLRLASAPDDVRDMVAQRYDTLSAAYELMKLENKRRRQALAKQIIAGKLTLLRLHDQVERILHPGERITKAAPEIPPLRDDALITATRKLNEALSELARAIGEDGQGRIAEGDRQNLAKFLTISRARLDNLVARLGPERSALALELANACRIPQQRDRLRDHDRGGDARGDGTLRPHGSARAGVLGREDRRRHQRDTRAVPALGGASS